MKRFKLASYLTENTPDNQIFKNLKLLTEEGLFKNGAVLFFGKQPEQIFENAIVRCVAFKGTDKRYIVDDKFFGGSLHTQYSKSIQWLMEKINISYDIEGQGSGPRKEIWEIPETVFKEAIINSLSHRDYYDKGSTTIVELFEDRVEISNPGGLVSAINRAEFGKKSHSRNPLIFGLFARMHLVEQVGSGIIRMNDLMKEADLPEPEYSTEGMFTVTLQRPVEIEVETVADSKRTSYKSSEKGSEISSDKTSEKILALIEQKNNITIFELAERIGITTRAIEKQINRLKYTNRLQHVGTKNGGYWRKKVEKITYKSSEIGSERSSERSSDKTSDKILKLIEQKYNITIFELAERIGITTRAIEKQINRLKYTNRLQHIGPKNGGHWSVLTEGAESNDKLKEFEKNSG